MASDSLDAQRQEAEGHQPLGEDAPGRIVHRLVAGAGSGRRDAGQLGVQHHLVHPTLRGR